VRIDVTVVQVEPDQIARALDPAASGRIEYPPELAEAPPQLAARIAGLVPKQLTEMGSPKRACREREVGREGPDLARCRQGNRHTHP
jgi:hypothetical protein